MSSESEESFSSSSLDVEIENVKPNLSNISIFFSQYSYMSSPIKFLEAVSQNYVLSSADLILAVAMIADYNSIKGCIDKRFKKTLNLLTESASGTIGFFFCPRITNVPLNYCQTRTHYELNYIYYIVLAWG